MSDIFENTAQAAENTSTAAYADAAAAANTADRAARSRRPVRQLSADVARKIAAGEVIDRPAAIVRELLDNAVDSGADRISVEIAGGGIDRIRVADNGAGMTKEDLAACARPHATSKIIDADDLMHLSTLGFRGEALASIAACARLTIASGTNKMRASLTEDHIIEETPPVQNGQGTIVMSEGLFENFPARRVFLKRPATETMLCREIFVEKALARTDIAFRLTVDGALRADLPANVSLAERFTRALELKEAPNLFYELKAQDVQWHFTLIIGEPSVRRGDRKQIFIYVNGRKINEYSLMQAIEYGVQGFFPNGTHPVAALFVEFEPALVDFNIHPAKREARFKDSAGLHHGVSSTVRDFFRAYGIQGARRQAQDEDAHVQQELAYSAPHEPIQQTADEKPYSAPRCNDSSSSISSLAAAALENDAPHADSCNTNADWATPRAPAEKSSQDASSADVRARLLGYDRAPLTHYGISHANPRTAGTTSGNTRAWSDRAERAQAAADGRFVADVLKSAYSKPLANDALSMPPAAATAFKPNTPDTADADGFRFVGSALGTFLVAEYNATLYFIDQHAAHERMLFDELTTGTAEKQELLIPFVIHTESEEDERYLESIRESLSKIGFEGHARSDKSGAWDFTAIPARWKGTESDLQHALLDERIPADKVMYAICAMTACKAAVKDGFVLDRATAADLAKKALVLSDPHCPHGRPVWTAFSRGELFARVRRTE